MSTLRPRDVLLEKVVTYFASHGVGDTSLRTLATAVGSSHRMLIYHFGSREGLLAAVIDEMARRQLSDLGSYLRTDSEPDPREVAWATWEHLADDASVFAPLFFEMSAQAMTGHEWAAPLRTLVDDGTRRLVLFFEKLGHPPERADLLGRTAMAVSRGAAFDLALSGDRKSADDVVRGFLDWALEDGRRPVEVEGRG